MHTHTVALGHASPHALMLGLPALHTSTEWKRGLRAQAERQVDELIALLDAIDGDPDVEDAPDADNDTEPSLGWAHAEKLGFYADVDDRSPRDFQGLMNDDREYDVADVRHDDDDLAEDGADGEPSLGALLNHHDQSRWAAGGDEDREDDQDSGLADSGALNLYHQENADAFLWTQASEGEQQERSRLLGRARQLAQEAMCRQGRPARDPDELIYIGPNVCLRPGSPAREHNERFGLVRTER